MRASQLTPILCLSKTARSFPFENQHVRRHVQLVKNMCRLFSSFFRNMPNSTENSARLASALRNVLESDDQIKTLPSTLEQFGRDGSHHRLGNPDVVVRPHTVDQVSKVVAYCNENKVPVIPYGAGSGLEGGVTAPHGGVTLDLSGLNEIISAHAEDFDCTVQAGVTREQLNKYLRDTGLWFPIDPGANSTLGGMCATSASGTNAVRYGTMRENVLNLQVVLPSGKVIYTKGEGRRARKSVAGYNLTNLFVGSEGTLGVITAATLKLYGIPENISAAVVSFSNIRRAVDAVVQILHSCIPVAKLEFLDDVQIAACNAYSKLELDVAPTLFVEFNGSDATIRPYIDMTKEICTSCNLGECKFKFAVDRQERERLWEARHNVYYACLALKPGARVP